MIVVGRCWLNITVARFPGPAATLGTAFGASAAIVFRLSPVGVTGLGGNMAVVWGRGGLLGVAGIDVGAGQATLFLAAARAAVWMGTGLGSLLGRLGDGVSGRRLLGPMKDWRGGYFTPHGTGVTLIPILLRTIPS
ncbi:hypothetical protein PUNSTDRAFT_119252 [Punctularia strigosozonata HHB-11173 SS5]|uniref:uncharacterized protein n=1 Tax=Punctularia strigosozonata (strain HHB-11173) TaxID=741275 RepID=UPI00044183C1|nr:uncharacterized protein PUNSTDRAFT_119252 [Punctularia strigosozonata HHB-11173 SS5]EIN10180.1 hypothetical protein PUNSTDRAFT_119252 [Punctularia strigosozonata HHB-11173 SS5]